MAASRGVMVGPGLGPGGSMGVPTRCGVGGEDRAGGGYDGGMSNAGSNEQEFVDHGPLWESLTHDPTTGVSIIDAQGVLCYVNPQAIAIFMDPKLEPEDVVGKTLEELYPPEFAAERRKVVTQCIESDAPILFRAIWHGRQHLSWIYPVQATELEPTPRALTITRYVAGDSDDSVMHQEGFERVNAEVIDLGELDILSPRELVVLALLGRGMSLKEAAFHLHRSVRTIETQRDSIGKKLKLGNRADLVHVVQKVGLTVDDVERNRL